MATATPKARKKIQTSEPPKKKPSEQKINSKANKVSAHKTLRGVRK